MPRCINCGHVYKRFGKSQNDGIVLGCSKCYRRFEDDKVEEYLNKFWKL